MLKLFKAYLGPYKFLIIGAFVFIVAQTATELMLPTIMSDIVDVGIVNSDVSYIIRRGALMLVWALISAVAIVCAAFCSARTSMGFGRDLRQAIFSKVTAMSSYEFDKLGTATLITRNTNDVQQLERVLNMLLTMLLFTPLMLIGALVMAFSTNAHLAVIACIAIPFLAAVVLAVMKFALPLVRSLQKKIDRLNLVTREGLSGIRVIRAYNRERYEQERFGGANGDLRDTNTKLGRLVGLLIPFITLILNGVVIALCWSGAIQVQGSTLQVGELMAVIQYALMILTSVMMLSMLFIILPRAIAAADRINEVFDTEITIQDRQGALDTPVSAAEPARLEFSHVGFTFPDAREAVLQDVSFCLEPGTTTVIIGSTGSGKSTIVNLAQRFIDPTEGVVSLNGVDLRDIEGTRLHEVISFVPQKSCLFTGTIADNIRYGNRDASEARMMAAARIAQAEGFILEKEQGYDTEVSQDGGNLSGGQRQRLAIARALCRDAALYIFDDSFSALDFKTDAALRMALRTEMPAVTKLIVAQRVSQAMDADQVLVLEEGRIVGAGTHEQLMETCEVYRDIALSQLSEDDLGMGGAGAGAFGAGTDKAGMARARTGEAGASGPQVASGGGASLLPPLWDDDDDDDDDDDVPDGGFVIAVKGHVTEEPCVPEPVFGTEGGERDA